MDDLRTFSNSTVQSYTNLLEKSAVRREHENDKYSVTNTGNHNESQTELESDFIRIERKTTRRIYLCGVKGGVGVEKIKQYIIMKRVNLLSNCIRSRHTHESTCSWAALYYIWLDSDLLTLLIGSEVVIMHQQNATHHLPVKATKQFCSHVCSNKYR